MLLNTPIRPPRQMYIPGRNTGGVVDFLVPQAAESADGDVLEQVYMSGYSLSLHNGGG